MEEKYCDIDEQMASFELTVCWGIMHAVWVDRQLMSIGYGPYRMGNALRPICSTCRPISVPHAHLRPN